MNFSKMRTRSNILDKPLSQGTGEVSLSCYAFLFSEIVQYCQNTVQTIPELENKLTEMGEHVGIRLIDLLCVREGSCKRELKLLHILFVVKFRLWRALFGKEADQLERCTDDDRLYYIVEKEPLVNTFISVPKEKGNFNCAVFIAGIVQGFLVGSGFPAKVTVQWHKGTTYTVEFEESVVAREKQLQEEA